VTLEIFAAILAAVITGLINWGAMRVELRWLRRDVDELRKRVAVLDSNATPRVRRL
jgi:hypothetical protein